MGSKRRYQRQLRVELKYAPGLDADGRVSKAIGILLKAAARECSQLKGSAITKKKGPPYQAPAEDVPTGGAEERG